MRRSMNRLEVGEHVGDQSVDGDQRVRGDQ